MQYAMYKKTHKSPPLRHPWFDVVMGLVWSNNLESSVGGSVATGRTSQTRQVKDDDPEKAA
jgi:hypothetical protein